MQDVDNGQRTGGVLRIVGLISGGQMGSDPFDPTSWSGCSRQFFLTCHRRGMLERAYGVGLPRWRFIALAATRVHRNREVWKARLYSSTEYRSALEQVLGTLIAEEDKRYPIVQLGAYVNAKRIYGVGARVFTYQDGNHEEFLRSGFAPRALTEDQGLARQCFEFEKRVAESAELVLTTSEYLRRSFIDLFGIPAERVKVLGFGINSALPPQSVVLEKNYDTMQILFVGKEFIRKGGDTVCQAFRIVRRNFPDATLHIVGPSSIPGEFLSDRGVHFHGFLSRAIAGQKEKLENLFRQSSLFAMPSRYEPFGLAPLEAMSYGIPAIVTGRWALKENISEGRTGFHVTTDDPSGLADRIIAAWSDPTGLAAMGREARSDVESRFTWDRVVDRLQALLAPPAKSAVDDQLPRRTDLSAALLHTTESQAARPLPPSDVSASDSTRGRPARLGSPPVRAAGSPPAPATHPRKFTPLRPLLTVVRSAMFRSRMLQALPESSRGRYRIPASGAGRPGHPRHRRNNY